MIRFGVFVILLLTTNRATAVYKWKLGKGTQYASNATEAKIPSIYYRNPDGQCFPQTTLRFCCIPANLLSYHISSDAATASRYELVDDTPGVQQGIFSMVNSAGAGDIYQEIPLDREQTAQYKINARAVDSSGKPVEPTDVEIEINVRDENDNSPIFEESSLAGNIPEDAPVGGLVMRLAAKDADGPGKDYGKVRFYYGGNESPSASSPRFVVSDSGEVSVVGDLDRETAPEITFTVIAKDGQDNPNAVRHSTEATVTITITDSNDHPPVFGSSSYAVTVGELLPLQSIVTTVSTTDQDLGKNAAAYFKIVSGNSDGHFSVRSKPSTVDGGESKGEIVLESGLDFESGVVEYNLEIVAYNKDSDNANDGNFQATTTVTVTVTDENEAPVFDQDPYFGSVGENIEGTVDDIATVHAEDMDFGGTQTVAYDVENTEGWFVVSANGVISAVNPVDREHPSVNQTTSQYTLRIRATDDYTQKPASSYVSVIITVGDVNDNAPRPGSGWNAVICENPSAAMMNNITVIHVVDADSQDNGPPYDIQIIKNPDEPSSLFFLELLTPATGALVQTFEKHFDVSVDPYEVPIQLIDTAATGETQQTSTHTLTVTVCSCNQEFVPTCNVSVPVAAGFPVGVLIAIIAAILILLIIVLAVVAYRRRNGAAADKEALFYDEDDVRENLQAYHDEGGGEEDNDGYDISALQAPPLIAPKRQDEPPLGGAQPQPRSRVPPDTDIGDYINDAKQQADNDPTAPPFDSLLVFDYEGQGSDAGSLSSLNSGTTDASQDYDYLNNWGPRFKKLADMYGGGESD